jgi:M6 family metalloprotease-like protein
MRNSFLLLLSLIYSSTYLVAQHSNCSVSPYPNTITQPEGSKITLYAYGNETVHYLETSDGYTVLKNKDGNFEYAMIGLDKNLTLSGIIASDNNLTVFGKNDLQKHLRYSAQQISLLNQYHDNLQEKNSFGKSGINVFPPTGNRKIIVVLMEFPDLRATISKSDFELLFNQTNYYGIGSFKDYYLKTSYGKLNLTVDVYGWYMAQNGYISYTSNSQALLQRATECIDSAGVDFSQYDSDNDGYVDAIMIMHAGIGAEEVNAPNYSNYIWSFRSTWGGSPTYNHGKKIGAFAMFPERRYYTNAMVGIGVMTHEFGHILDLPDFYATNYNNTGGGPEGVGDFANMAGGPWLNNEHTPCLHDAYSKVLLGWLTPTTINVVGNYTIAKSAADSNFAFKINTSRSNEYFLLENKQNKGFDKYIPGKGLAIWHVNTQMAGKLSTTGNNTNNDTSNEGLGILQADARFDLEKGLNRGDYGDLYPGTTSNHNVTPYTKPNSSLFYSKSGVRQSSNLYFTGITINSDSSVTFKLGSLASASYIPSITSGCAPLAVSFTNSSVFANSYLWNLGDGTISTDTNQKHVYTQPGTYPVWLRVLDSAGVVVDSVKQMISVNSSPIAHVGFARFGDTVNFTNTSTNATSYLWQFGNYSSSKKVLDPIDLRIIQDTGIVHFTMIAFSSNGCTDTAQFSIDIWRTGINTMNSNMIKISLYPNPIEHLTILSFSTIQTEFVNIEIYNMVGEKVFILENRELPSGTHEYVISKDILPAFGMYIVKIISSSQSGFVKLLNH